MAQSDEDFVLGDDHLDPAERDPEAPPEDAAEQATPADPAQAPAPAPADVRVPLEADEADAVDQSKVVELDEDAYP